MAKKDQQSKKTKLTSYCAQKQVKRAKERKKMAKTKTSNNENSKQKLNLKQRKAME